MVISRRSSKRFASRIRRTSLVSDIAAPSPPFGPAISAPNAGTIGMLLVEMAALLAPTLGAEAPREARELLAALHDMPRHWPSVVRAEPVDAAAWARALAAAARRARGAPQQYAAGQAAFRHLTLA